MHIFLVFLIFNISNYIWHLIFTKIPWEKCWSPW